MSERLPESHLLPDAVVAFVDAELSLGAQERAAAHLARCASCAAEVSAQRQARTAVRDADAPAMSEGFLANLRSIPAETEVPVGPDNLAVTGDGQLVAVQRPERVAGLRSNGAERSGGSGSAPGDVFDDSAPGEHARSLAVAAGPPAWRRRGAQGAGVVVSGIVLSALALVGTAEFDDDARQVPDGGGPPDVLRVQFRMPESSVAGSTSSPAPSPTSVVSPASPVGQR